MIVGIPLKDLQTGVGVGDVAGGGTLPAAALRRWACDTGIIPMVLGADSQILDYGRQTRVVSSGLRLYVVARDGGCVFPGCDRPPSWCECHHRIHVINGGPTKPENLDLLCVRHHHLVPRRRLDHHHRRRPPTNPLVPPTRRPTNHSKANEDHSSHSHARKLTEDKRPAAPAGSERRHEVAAIVSDGTRPRAPDWCGAMCPCRQ